MFAALLYSWPLRYALIGLALFSGIEAWNYHQRKIGAEREAAKIEKKANADTKQADEVRDAVAVAKPFSGLRDPNRRDAGNKP